MHCCFCSFSLQINENGPVYDQSFYNVTVPEDATVGDCILQVAASDPDCGVNALVNYSFAALNLVAFTYHSGPVSNSFHLSNSRSSQKYSVSAGSKPASVGATFGGQQHADFSIDPKSGQLCIARPLDFERTSVYDIPILATDRGK